MRIMKPCIFYADSCWKKKGSRDGSGGGHFIGSNKMVPIESGVQRTVEHFILSRHACFLVAMNGESTLPEISAA
jgi:hypothetical protein